MSGRWSRRPKGVGLEGDDFRGLLHTSERWKVSSWKMQRERISNAVTQWNEMHIRGDKTTKKKPDKTRRIRLFDGALGQSLQQEGICTCFKLKDTQTFMIPQRFSRKLPVPLLAFGLGSLVQLGMVGRKMLAGWTLAVPFRIKDRCKQTQRAQEGACFLSSWRRVCRLLRGGSRFQRIARRVKTFSRHFWA